MRQRFFPSLTTERLLLRQLQPSDDKAIFALRSNEAVNTYIQRPLSNNIDDARYFITSITEGVNNKEWLYWAMILKDTQQLVGTICLWHFSDDKSTAEIGYELHPSYQGKGLMDEALKGIINYGFNILQLTTIEAYTQPANERSIKLLEKNNFVKGPINNSSAVSREIQFILRKSTT